MAIVSRALVPAERGLLYAAIGIIPGYGGAANRQYMYRDARIGGDSPSTNGETFCSSFATYYLL